MLDNIMKRDGRLVPFDQSKIAAAISKAFDAAQCPINPEVVKSLAQEVTVLLLKRADGVPTVEDIQDLVEKVLIQEDFAAVAKHYILYRAERTRIREAKSRLMNTLRDITFSEAADSDVKRENANVDGNTAMGTMLKYGSEASKQAYLEFLIKPEHAEAHRRGDIHIHDLDFYGLTTTCTQIDLRSLFKGGFATGHGHLREPQSIGSYAALAAIAIQSNQNDQHGGQSVVDFDYAMAEGVRKTYARHFDHYANLLLDIDPEYTTTDTIKKYAMEATVRDTYQAMEGFIHNLNTMHSRAGAQVPFSSINYGLDTSWEGRLVVEQLLRVTEAGLGHGETPIFPIQIYRVKEGINYNPGDPNYDLFKLAIRCSAKRLFPNFAFVDAPFNLQYYKEGRPETEIAYMGCRTRVMANIYDPTLEISPRRGNLSFTSINLPRLAIEAKGDYTVFMSELTRTMYLCVQQLLDRLEIQSRRKVYNMPFLMGQGVWLDSEKLKWDDEVREVIKHGTLSVGFIGLAETLKMLTGCHHGESAEAQELGLKIIAYMRKFMDSMAQEYTLNFSLLATPAEGLSGRFVRMDREKYGVIPGVTDREYYTNSFHIPVYHPIGAFDKIRLEAPYHALTNAGHITYIEMDGDPTKNLEAMEAVVRAMHDAGIGYGSINHPVDRDPVCGYNGIIDDECPQCGRREDDVRFERIRRITGYLVGTTDRWNNAKRAEERDRVKHT